MKTARTILFAVAIAMATSTGARAHDGAGPHSHGSTDPRPSAATRTTSDDRADEGVATSDRAETRRETERPARDAKSTPER